ncbi:MAG: hypothetical protein ACFFCZ_01770 [Promethearchaeota archaeon]
MANLSLYILAYFFQGIVFFILSIRMMLVYRKNKILASFFHLLFFIAVSIQGFAIGLIYTVPLPELQPYSIYIGIIAVTFLLLAAFSMIERYIWFPVVIGASIGLIFITLVLQETYIELRPLILAIAFTISLIPTTLFYFYLYLRTNDGKILGYSIGLSLWIISGLFTRVSPEISGLFNIFVSLTMAAALFGLFDKYIIPKIPRKSQTQTYN